MDIWYSSTEINPELYSIKSQIKIRSDDVIIPFVKRGNGLYYLEEYISGEQSQAAVAMVAQKLLQLCNAELVTIQLCHICPTLMRHLFRMATNIQQLKT